MVAYQMTRFVYLFCYRRIINHPVADAEECRRNVI